MGTVHVVTALAVATPGLLWLLLGLWAWSLPQLCCSAHMSPVTPSTLRRVVHMDPACQRDHLGDLGRALGV